MKSRSESTIVSASLQALQEALETGTMRQLRRMVSALNSGEIADLLESLPPTQRAVVWELIATEDEGDVLVQLNDEVCATLIGAMDTEELVAATANRP